MNVCCISDGDHFAQEQWVDSTTKTSLMLCSQKIYSLNLCWQIYTSVQLHLSRKSGKVGNFFCLESGNHRRCFSCCGSVDTAWWFVGRVAEAAWKWTEIVLTRVSLEEYWQDSTPAETSTSVSLSLTCTTCPPSLSFLSVFSFQSRASIVGLRAEIQSCRPKAKWGQSGRSTSPRR